MKTCPNCKKEMEDFSAFCPNCGFSFASAPGQQQPPAVYAVDPADHTAEFAPQDISDNKIFAMLPYLMGFVGIIIALLAMGQSKYAAFHLRQALKIEVVSILLGIVTLILCWTIVVPIAAAIFFVILFVLKIICFFQVCSGKAKEPAIISSLGFLK